MALMRALQLDPDQRFQNAADLKGALRSPKPPAPPSRMPGPQPPNTRTYPLGWAGAVGVLSLFVLVLLLFIARDRRGSLSTATQSSQAVAILSPSPKFRTPPPTSSAKPPASPGPSETPAVYIVQPGDTCLGIAIQFGTSIDSIVALNDLPPDCGLLYVDQELLIPAAEVSPAPGATTPSLTITPPEPLKTKTAESDGMILVYIPEGEFLMGSADSDSLAGDDEKPQRTVRLDGFWIDRTEVTNGMYTSCLQNGVCQLPGDVSSKLRPAYFDDPNYENYPVLFVSWRDASTYCDWAGRRLPSEAEWEKAARGMNGQIYPWGEFPPSSKLANFGNYVGDTSPVGKYPAGTSPFGALDMAGNISEWVADWYGDDYYVAGALDNPLGPDAGEFRVLRGGSWFSQARAVRSAFRAWNYPETQTDSIGFRCALSE